MIKSGIYKIQSILEPEKFYIGSSVNLQSRKRQHFSTLKLNKLGNCYLQNYYNAHGKESLLFLIIEECGREKLVEREQFYLDSLLPVFNSRKIADSNYGHVFSEETKKNMSEAQKLWRKDRDFTTQLTSTNITRIVELKEEGLTNTEVAKQLDISMTSISNALTGKTKYSVNYSKRVRKLNETKVKEIKKLIILGYTLKSIAKKYGVINSVISNIKAGRIWKSIVFEDNIDVCTLGLIMETELTPAQIKDIKFKIDLLSKVRGELKKLSQQLNIPYHKVIDIKRNKTNYNGL